MNAPSSAAIAMTAAAGGAGASPEIAAFGEWDTANLGDRGIHQGVLRYFSQSGWRVRSYGVSTLTPVAPAGGPVEVPIAAPRRLAAAIGKARGLKRVMRAARQRVRMVALSDSLEPARALLVGGGALLSDSNLHFPQSLVELSRYARRARKPLLCLGCGAEGEWSPQGERMIREFLSACSVVAVRDEATADRVAPMLGAAPPVFGDFCLSEELVRGDHECGRDRRGIAINVSQLPGPWAQAQERYETALVALTSRLARDAAGRCGGVRIFTTGLPEDGRAAERVHARIEAAGAQLYLPKNLAQLSAMLRTSAAVVSTRLHAAILALAEHVPVVGFSAAPKLRDFLATLGIGRYCHGLDDGPRLAGWLAAADYDRLFAEQHRALVHAPLWRERTWIRGEIESLRGVNACT